MSKKKRAGRMPAVPVPVVARSLPEPFTAFQEWAKQQKNGQVLIDAVVRVAEIYVALADGLAVPKEECGYAFDLADYLYDLAVARGFTEAAEMLEDACKFLCAVLEGRA